jgi:hypothetical protein
MTAVTTGSSTSRRQLPRLLRQPVVWGLAFGAGQLLAPVVLRWLDTSTIQALLLCLIAGVYIGFAVADGRPIVIAVESTVTTVFVVLAAVSVTGSVWMLVAAYVAHGAKDLWQERTHFVAGTRWWPPFCVTVDWLVALVLAVEVWGGVSLQQ